MSDIQGAETMEPLLDMITGAGAESTALTILPKAELIFVPGGAESSLELIREKARKEAAVLDASTETGRKAITSLEFKVRKLKVSGDNAGKELKAQYQQIINPIDAERRVWREGLDALAEEIGQPVAEFRARETARVSAHEAALLEIDRWTDFAEPPTAADYAERLASLNTSPLLSRDWQEFRERAQTRVATSIDLLKRDHAAATTREAEGAELERLRAEAAERDRQEAARLQAEREAQIAAEAAEAARVAAEAAAAEEAARVAAQAEAARVEAERVTQAAAEAAEAERLRLIREAEEAEAAAAERERLAAEALAEEQRRAARLEREQREARERMEAARVLRHQQSIAEIEAARNGFASKTPSGHIQGRIDAVITGWGGETRDWQEFAERAAEARADTLQELRALLRSAIEREDAEREAARIEADRIATEAERQRVEGIRIQQEADLRRREADKAHRGKINREALADLMKLGLSEELGKAVVSALAKSEIRHCKLEY